MSCLRRWIIQFNCFTANCKYAGKHCPGICLGKMLIGQVQKFTLYIHFFPQWAEPCVHSVFLEMWLLLTWKKRRWKDIWRPVGLREEEQQDLYFWQHHLFWCNIMLLWISIWACYFLYLFLDLGHLCPCMQFTLWFSLLFHVYHTSSFPHSHIIY